MKHLFRRLAALSLASFTLLSGCGDYLDSSDTRQEPTYSTLEIVTEAPTEATETKPVGTTEAATENAVTSAATKKTKAAKTTAATTKKTKAAKTTAKTTKTTAAKTTEAPTTAAYNEDYVEYHFRSKKLLDQHFEKHGAEFKDDFGYKDASEYEKGASDVINNSSALHKTEKDDGDYVYYIVDTNEFVVLSKDGYIRTYFRPDQGKKYYDKQ